MTVALVGSTRGRGLIRDAHLHPTDTHIGLLGRAALRASVPTVAGSWDMLAAIGGNGDQGNVSSCKGWASRKSFGLFALGQTGIPREFSAGWIYTCARAKARALELGGAPTFQQIEANPLTDSGSEPSCAVLGVQQVGLALEADWPTVTDGSNPARLNAELELGPELVAQLWKPQAMGYGSIVATGADLLQATNVALSSFADGKRGRGVELSLASGTQAIDGADGTRVLTAADFNGRDFDHAGIVIGYRWNATTNSYEYLWSNSWGDTWAAATTAPELDATGTPTGGTVQVPGCVWISSDALLAAADWTLLGETNAS